MSTRVASLYAEVTAKVDSAISSLGRVRNEINQTGTGADELGSRFAGFAKAATVAMGTFVAAAAAAKVAFDFGEMGAGVLQVEQSFDHLLTTVGAAPDTFDQMRAAAQGTMSDFDLMRGGTTLLAGTTGELGKAFADALPELTAVARAAAVLNPEIGSTGEAMDRLSRGIKKAEPELLDELGILLNLTQVFKAYGESIGKSATDLTKAEKSQAMLNAVLEQGETLVNQAAGATNEYKTSIDQMHASIENAQNALAKKFAPAAAAAAEAIVEMLTPLSELVQTMERAENAAFDSSKSYGDYKASVDAAAKANGFMVDASGNLVRLIRTQHGVVRQVVKENYAFSESEYAAVQASIRLGESVEALSGSFRNAAEAANETKEAITGMSDEALAAWSERLQATAEATESYQQALRETEIAAAGLAAGLRGDLTAAAIDYGASMQELAIQQAEIVAEMTLLEQAGQTATQRYGELTAALGENIAAQEQSIEAVQRATSELIYNQVATMLNAQGQLDLARNLGLISELDYLVASTTAQVTQAYDENSDGAIDAGKSAAAMGAELMTVKRAAESLAMQGNLTPTLEEWNAELQKIALADAAAALTGTGTAAGATVDPLTDLGDAAGDAAEGTGDAAANGEDLEASLDGIKSAASAAVGPLSALRQPLTNLYDPLSQAAGAAEDLGDGLRSIPRGGINISVTTSGFPAAINYVNQLANGLNNIPSSVTATVRVQAQSDGNGSAGGGAGGGGGPPPQNFVTETYNIYNPLAAAIVVEQKNAAVRQRMEALING